MLPLWELYVELVFCQPPAVLPFCLSESALRNSFNFYQVQPFLCLLEPVMGVDVWNIVTNAERVDGNSIGLTLGFVEETQSFKIFSLNIIFQVFKFSTKVWEKHASPIQ